MILPDVNVLVYAFHAQSPRHEVYERWLGEVLAGEEEVALSGLVLAGFLRVSTNRRAMRVPAPVSMAMDFVDDLRAAPRTRWLSSEAPTWDRLRSLVAGDAGIVSNVVPDAYLAATAIAQGCRLATADRGFARFPGLRFFDPADQETAGPPARS